MIGEVVMFLTVTAVVARPRPDVEQLDPAPPTSSFPSGHTYAAFVLWGGIAALAHWQRWAPHLRRMAMVLAMVLPLAVGASRIYRGMHHPTDVVASLVLGLVWVVALVVITPQPIRLGWRPRNVESTSMAMRKVRGTKWPTRSRGELSQARYRGTRVERRRSDRNTTFSVSTGRLAVDAVDRLQAAGQDAGRCPFAGFHGGVFDLPFPP